VRADTTLFYDVDTQCDFILPGVILPGGRLSTPGTDRVVPKLATLTRLEIPIVASVDRRFPGDPELQRNGGDFPNHCMDGTLGQRKIEATAPLNPLYIENRDLHERELAAASPIAVNSSSRNSSSMFLQETPTLDCS